MQADVQAFEAVLGNVNDMFANTGQLLGGMFDALSAASGYDALKIREAIQEESRRRDELLVLQKELTEAEIDYTQARTKRLESGTGLINISAAGVYPELELVLQKIIERAQMIKSTMGTEQSTSPQSLARGNTAELRSSWSSKTPMNPI